MPVTLPYRFDASPVVKMILRGALGLLLLVVVPAIFYSLIVSRNLLAVVQLISVAAIGSYFSRLILKNLEGSQGTISADTVSVSPGNLYGTRLAGPSGRFSVNAFRAVRVQLISTPIEAQGRRRERVSLVGKEGTPDILVARTQLGAGRSLGRDLSIALNLSYEVELAPY